MVWDTVTSLCTTNPFCWLLGDNTVVPKGSQTQCVPELYFFSICVKIKLEVEEYRCYEPQLFY